MVVFKSIGLHTILIGWIKECITTSSFSVCINKEVEGLFKSTRRLKQWDPISSYLFVIVIEVFSYVIGKLSKDEKFKYHWKCHEMDIIYLCFVDELLIFCRAENETMTIIKQAMEIFHKWSGLKANNSKSCIFLSRLS